MELTTLILTFAKVIPTQVYIIVFCTILRHIGRSNFSPEQINFKKMNGKRSTLALIKRKGGSCFNFRQKKNSKQEKLS